MLSRIIFCYYICTAVATASAINSNQNQLSRRLRGEIKQSSDAKAPIHNDDVADDANKALRRRASSEDDSSNIVNIDAIMAAMGRTSSRPVPTPRSNPTTITTTAAPKTTTTTTTTTTTEDLFGLFSFGYDCEIDGRTEIIEVGLVDC
mmetsp:Transcript_20879/g.26569  ORF Transcript_20879/g.26569 Transcript_20879/m.26569 type:complete len:148 (+) Transcript_20879:164-607(+)